MKKIVFSILACGLAFGFYACKKTPAVVSTVETYSEPTITLTGSEFYSIPIGGSIPAISATAYDSFYKEVCPIKLEAGDLDNSTPGIYFVSMRADNHLGMYSKKTVMLAVTNVPAAYDLSGTYVRTATGVPVGVTKLATGLYQTDNYYGAASTPNNAAVWLHVDDSTMMMPAQETINGLLKSKDHFLRILPGDTAYGYRLLTTTSNTAALRTFQKQ